MRDVPFYRSILANKWKRNDRIRKYFSTVNALMDPGNDDGD